MTMRAADGDPGQEPGSSGNDGQRERGLAVIPVLARVLPDLVWRDHQGPSSYPSAQTARHSRNRLQRRHRIARVISAASASRSGVRDPAWYQTYPLRSR